MLSSHIHIFTDDMGSFFRDMKTNYETLTLAMSLLQHKCLRFIYSLCISM